MNNENMVDHPSHYGGKEDPYEVIKVCEAWGLDKDAYLFNVVKYVARAGKKNPQKKIEDLEKAVFYLKRRIELLSHPIYGKVPNENNDPRELVMG